MSYILVVDDELAMREILRLMLHRLDIPVECAGNGLQALEKIKAEKPALLLLDIMMPVMNGTELLSQLRAHPDYFDIPVLLISAITRDRLNLQELMENDLWVDFIGKGEFTPKGLLHRVTTMIDRSLGMNGQAYFPASSIPEVPQKAINDLPH